MVYNINIAECDNKAKIKMVMSNCIRSAIKIAGFIADVASEPTYVVANSNIGHEARGAKRRRAGVASTVDKNSVNEGGVKTSPSSKFAAADQGRDKPPRIPGYFLS
jgi:hypothetical protein